MAFLVTTSVSSSIGSTASCGVLMDFPFLVGFFLVGFTSVFADAVAQTRRCGHPNIVALEIHIEDVVVSEGSGRFHRGHLFVRSGNDDLSAAGFCVGPVGDP